MTKIDEIEEARKAGIPSIAMYREIERLRLNATTAYTKELRDSAMRELGEVVIRARRIQKARAFIVFASFLFGMATLALYIHAVHFGYSRLVAPVFGLPAISLIDTFLTIFVLKFMWKGYASREAIEKSLNESKEENALLWLDRTKRFSKVNAHNVGSALMVTLFFYVFTLFL